ncbi:MAG TPA: hypothetical protein VE396_18275 [Xanthobacteraceae bacterium]|jgi:hypothetical protein|nr:hypothetical protein [Xanthobacteraceae bacterium]
MNASVISALAALAGATIGGLMTVIASWLVQQREARAQWFTHDRLRREDIYKEFIDQASKCYVDALQHDATKPDIGGLVVLYSTINRMRVLSSPQVVASAERVVQRILDTYLEPDKSFLELRDMVKSRAIDLLEEFADVSREEFATLRARYF